jgi:hypothetical protein
MKLLFSNGWLREHFASDPDEDPQAGNLDGEPEMLHVGEEEDEGERATRPRTDEALAEEERLRARVDELGDELEKVSRLWKEEAAARGRAEEKLTKIAEIVGAAAPAIAAMTLPAPPRDAVAVNVRRPDGSLLARFDASGARRSVPPIGGSVRQRILGALSELEAAGISPAPRIQVALFAGYGNPRSPGFQNPLGALRTEGLLDYPTPGSIVLTAKGRAEAPKARRPSQMDFHDRLFGLLGGVHSRILRPLIQRYPRPMERVALAEAAGYGNARSPEFQNPLGRLRSLGLIDYPQPGLVKAEPVLFLERGA